jgi:Tol biopolymer transport system component/DNA-binding winged helix-turn-helix (wHTH) protein
MSSLISHFYKFGDFAVDMDQRILLRHDRPVALTPKVFDTLLVLVENSGRLVTKDELMNSLWPDSFVEEANLTFNIQQLRKSLGDSARKPVYVETVARRGYRFIAEVEEVLTDTSPKHPQIRVRSNGGDAARRKPAGEFLIANHENFEVPRIETAMQNNSAVPEIGNRRTFLIAGLLVVMLSGTGLLIWRFSHLVRNQNENRRAGFSSSVSAPSLKLQRLTANGKSSHPVISPDSKFVAYINETKEEPSIWLKQLATNTTREIVESNGGGIGGLGFSRDGENLYFARIETGRRFTLYRVSLIGGLPTKLIANVEGTFSVSPDDSQIAFIRNSDDDKKCALMIAHADGSNERELIVHEQPDRFNTPSWSPDGQSIAVAVGPSDSGGQEVRVVEINVADGSQRALISDGWFHINRLVWLPDKSGLVVSGSRKLGDTGLWRISYPTGEVNQITDGITPYQTISISADASKAVAAEVSRVSHIWVGPGNQPQNLTRITQAIQSFCWMPGGQIVYSSNASVGTDLWLMNPDGTNQRQLTNTGYNDEPAISSDGRYIVFISNRTGSRQIWRMNADGSNQIQLTNVKGVHALSISPDGQWVVYRPSHSWDLWRVSIDGGEPVRLTKNYSVYPSVSPDGKVIACIGKDAQNHRKLLIIPFEGGQPLKEFDFATPHLSAVRLQWTPDAKNLIYAASRDRMASLYKQSCDGGAPKRMVTLNEDDLFDFSYSPDGRYLAAVRGGWHFDVVLLTDFNHR